MSMTRQAFCASMAGSTVTLLLQGCGGGGYSGSGSSPPPAGSVTCGASASDISANHGHSLSILKADLDATADKTYTLAPSIEGHVHTVTFSVAQLGLLKGGGSVTVTSSVTAAGAAYGGTHSHAVTASVAASCA